MLHKESHELVKIYPMLKELSKILFVTLIIVSMTNCSNDDDDCPDEIIVNINDPESLERAEKCSLSPAEPIGESLWLYKFQ